MIKHLKEYKSDRAINFMSKVKTKTKEKIKKDKKNKITAS
jgi:hypothetical protein